MLHDAEASACDRFAQKPVLTVNAKGILGVIWGNVFGNMSWDGDWLVRGIRSVRRVWEGGSARGEG